MSEFMSLLAEKRMQRKVAALIFTLLILFSQPPRKLAIAGEEKKVFSLAVSSIAFGKVNINDASADLKDP